MVRKKCTEVDAPKVEALVQRFREQNNGYLDSRIVPLSKDDDESLQRDEM